MVNEGKSLIRLGYCLSLWHFLCVGLMLLFPCRSYGIAVGAMDEFDNGTTQGWSGYGTVSNPGTGGPGGAGDGYLMANSTGAPGEEGQLLVSSQLSSHWTGDYVSAGVKAISMDLINLGSEPLEIRLLIGGNYGDWTTTTAFVLPADNQWYTAVFGLGASSMTWGGDQGGSNASLENALRYLDRLIIRHQSGPPLGWRGATPIEGQLGIDNITAIPEPATGIVVALLIGLATIGMRKLGISGFAYER